MECSLIGTLKQLARPLRPMARKIREYQDVKKRIYNPAFAGPPGSAQELAIQVHGHGATGYGLESSGFTPGGEYLTEVKYPDDTEYAYLKKVGKVGPDGDTPHWWWDCLVTANGERDPEGVYHLKMTDLTTGHSVETTFEVSY